MSLRITSRIIVTVVAASLAACGDSKSGLVTPTVVNYPSVVGSYNATWTTQYNRTWTATTVHSLATALSP